MGLRFEAYLHDCFSTGRLHRGRLHRRPSFANGAKFARSFHRRIAFILCEYKSSVLRPDAKLSGRLDQLEPELQKKFVTGDDDGRKGVANSAGVSGV